MSNPTDAEHRFQFSERKAAARTTLAREIGEPIIGTPQFSEQFLSRCRCQGVSAPRQEVDERLVRACEVMAEQPFAPHTVGSLAALAGMSRSSFAQRFGDRIGQTPIRFLKIERLRCAAYLLCTTSLPVKVVAAKVGYLSRSYFSRSFRDAFGVPPGDVRALGLRAQEAPFLPSGLAG